MSKMDKKLLKLYMNMSKNTVLGYKKGLKSQNMFSDFENMYFQLSNALSIVFISLKVVEILHIKFFSVAPPSGAPDFTSFSKQTYIDFDKQNKYCCLLTNPFGFSNVKLILELSTCSILLKPYIELDR